MTGEWSREEAQVAEIVVRDLVSDYECGRILVRTALEEATPEIDVLPWSSERGERIEPRNLDDEPHGRGTILLQALGYCANPFGHEAVPLEVHVLGDLAMQPLAEQESALELEIRVMHFSGWPIS